METSEHIEELAVALAQAQGKFGAVKQTGKNPMFKSNYATFDDVVTAVRAPLSDAGISYLQILDSCDKGASLTTMLLHNSGQWIKSTVPLVVVASNRGTNEVQAFGSALTYMKRYALAAMLGVASDDDNDGNTEPARPPQKRKPQAPPKPAFDAESDAKMVELLVEEAAEEAPQGGQIKTTEFGALEINGKKCIGFFEEGHPRAAILWWGGRPNLINTAPWISAYYTQDAMGSVGARNKLFALITWEPSGKFDRDGQPYKNIVKIEERPAPSAAPALHYPGDR